jgi:large subunit ribosomal protein L28
VTKRRWNINLQKVRTLISGTSRKLRVCTSCIKNGKIEKAA